MASVEELCDNIALINNSKTVLSGEINEVKEKFKDNLFEIAYKSKSDISLSPGNYTLKETKRERNIHYANVKINNGKVPNDLIKEIINQAEIVSFREILPSINDIFIQQVSSNQS